MTQLNTPYPSTAYLTGFLREQGVDARQEDLALALVLELFSPAGLDAVRGRAEALPERARSRQVRHFLARFDRYRATVGPAVAFLQGQDPTVGHRIAGRAFLPEGPRFEALDVFIAGEKDQDPLAWAFGALGTHDRARHLATLYLNDLADVLRDAVDPRFEFVRYAESLAGPPDNGAASERDDSRPSGTSTPDRPSERYVSVDNTLLRIDHPDNWQSYGRGDAMTITPRGGLIADDQGIQALAHGVIVSLLEQRTNAYGQTLQGRGYGQDSARDAATRLEQSTDQLFEDLRLSNRNMRVTQSPRAIRVDGERALSTYLSNDSPVGGRETDWIVTLEHPDGLLFIVFTAPEPDVRRYESAFQAMLRSVRIKR